MPDALYDLGIDSNRARQLIRLAIDEDLGPAGDITTLCSQLSGHAEARLITREAGTWAGLVLVPEILSHYDEALEFLPRAQDGTEMSPNRLGGVIRGPVTSILSCERVVLNYLQRLCGIATLTRRFVHKIKGTQAHIYDTRKTLPGWRDLDKYAVRCGGGRNHRRNLSDGILVKDNHLAGIVPGRLAYRAFEILSAASTLETKPTSVEFEVDSLAQLEQLMTVVGIDIILLDNFSPADLRAAVAMRQRHGLCGKIELEASGGITLDTVQSIAHTGVDRISIGSLTHSARAVDLSLEIDRT